MIYQLTIRRDTRAEWVKYNPILALGEPAFVTDEDKLYIGDGIHHFVELSPINKDVSITWDEITGKPIFSAVAESGSYNDLTDKPTIPSLDGYATEQWVEDKGYLTEQDITGKADKDDTYTKGEVNALIPDVSSFITKSVDDLENYYTKTGTYTKEEVDQIIGSIHNLNISIVEALPEVGDSNTIYLVKKATEGESDVYDEYLYVSGKWEHIGNTEIDLTNYYTKEEVDVKLDEKANKDEAIKGWYGTREEYEAIAVKDPNTTYFIEGGEEKNLINIIALSNEERINIYENPSQYFFKELYYFNTYNASNYGDMVIITYWQKGINKLSLTGFSRIGYIEEIIINSNGTITRTAQSEIPYVPKKTSQLINDSNFLTEHQSLDGYATEQWVEDKGYLTEHQPLKTINGEDIVGEGNIEIQGGSGNNWYGTEEEFLALGEYDETGNTNYFIEGQIDYKKDIKNLPLIPKKVSELPNDAHYVQGVKKINGISMRGEGEIDIMKIIDKYHWWGTQEEYDALEEIDPNVQYHIEGNGGGGDEGRKTFYLNILNTTSVEAKMQAAEIAQYAIQNQTTDFVVIGINGVDNTLTSSDISTNGINELTINFLWGNGVETVTLTALSATNINITRDGVSIPQETRTLTFTFEDGTEENIEFLIKQ